METSRGNILLSHYAYPNLHGAQTHFYCKAGEFKAHKTYMQLKGCYLSFIGHLHPQSLVIASWRMKGRRSDRSYKVKKGDCVAVPAIVDTGSGGGFCIFNAEDQSVTAIRY
ncbi:MAG: hypothetical protein IH599_09990 [Bacteroidales bacterium]|nr:hypothetical protein [Bacteroidales bacterium]